MNKIGVKFIKNSIEMNFLNGSTMIPGSYGGYVIASGCGSGKTTVIKDIIRQKFNEGILYAAGTIKEVDDMYNWIVNNVVNVVQPENNSILTLDDIIVLHSENEEYRDVYRINPDEITRKKVVLCTHYKFLHDDPRILIKQNFDIRRYRPEITYARDSVTLDLDPGSEYRRPRQYILIDEMPICDQLNAYFQKAAKINLLDTVVYTKSHVEKDVNNNDIEVLDDTRFTLRPFRFRDQFMMSYSTRVMGMPYDPFPASSNSNDDFKKSVPAQLRRDLLIDSFIENEAIFINTSDYSEIKDGYVKYSVTDLVLNEMHTRILIFDGTGDLTFGFDNGKFNLRNIKDKYNSKCNIIKIDGNIARKFKESYILNNENKIYDKIDKCCYQIIDIINSNYKTLIVTWKDLKMISDTSKKSSIKLTSSIYNENFTLPEYITNRLIELGVPKDKFSIIHYQSGLDKATNEFREYDSIVFLGEFHVPNSAVEEFNRTYCAKSNLFRFTLYQLVQAVCRTRIRNHNHESVNIYMTDDWDNRLIMALNLYLNYNRYEDIEFLSNPNIEVGPLNSIGSPTLMDHTTTKLSNKWRPVVEKLDSELFPGLLRDIQMCIPRELTVRLDDIHKVVPLKIKEIRKYHPLINYLRKFNVNLTIIK